MKGQRFCLFFTLLFISSLSLASTKTLRELAQHRNFLVGGAMRLSPETQNDPDYFKSFSKEFNVVVAEHVMKFEHTHPFENVYDFSKGDLIVRFAKDNDMKVRGHTLLWHEANPSWITKGKWTSSDLHQIMKAHIENVSRHFKGDVIGWDVVNEAFDEYGQISNQGPWPKIDKRRKAGDYVRDAFVYAHEADPQAQLFYNDYSAEEMNSKSDGIYKFLKKMKADGLPIHGIGFQVHINADESISEKSIRKNFQRFADLGLVIHITEMDVGIKKTLNRKTALKMQAEQYAKLMRACLETPQCQAFLTWGLTDKFSWIDESGDLTAALLLDERYQHKPAYETVADLLEIRH